MDASGINFEQHAEDQRVRDAFLYEAEAPRHLIGGNVMSVDERYAYVRAHAETPEQIQAEYDQARDALTAEYARIQRSQHAA